MNGVFSILATGRRFAVYGVVGAEGRFGGDDFSYSEHACSYCFFPFYGVGVAIYWRVYFPIVKGTGYF